MKKKRGHLANFSENQRDEAERRYWIIQPNMSKGISLAAISKEHNISIRTLYRWKRNYLNFGLSGLIHAPRADSGKIRMEESVRLLVQSLRLKNRRISIATIHRNVAQQCKKNKFPIPSYYQVYKVIKNMPIALIELSHNGEKKYQEKYDLVYTRESDQPNEIWQADHTLLDIMVLDGKNEQRRPWLSVIIDDYSRAVAGYFISFENPSAVNTSLMLYQAIWRKENSEWPICGIPEKFYTDHGSDFTSKHLEQVAIDLKMELVFSTIGVPRGRGKVERFFQTVNQLLLEKLPGYLKNRTRNSLLTIQDLEQKIEEFLIYEYNHRKHSSIQTTPVKRWNESGFLPNMPKSLEELDLLLLQISKSRKIHPDGIHFQGFRYTNPNLSAFVGESVQIRYNPQDFAEIRVFFQNKFLCTAITPELSNFKVGIKDIVAARNKRKQSLKKQSSIIKSVTETLIEEKTSELNLEHKMTKKSKLKRYFND